MKKFEKAKNIVDLLEKAYPDAQCSLEYEKPHELLISVRLAAQCTDARVNMVTPALFECFKSIDDFAKANVSEVEEYVKSCGLYKTKAKDIVAMCKMLKENFNSTMPDNMDDLLKLPGVGRKSANLILGDVYHKEVVVCDTHCIRITNLLGLTTSKDPFKTEMELRKILPMNKANDFCHRLVLHGRAICVARHPKCNECCLKDICKFNLNNKGKAGT